MAFGTLSVHLFMIIPFEFFDDRSPIKDGPDKGRCHIKIQATIPVIENGQKVWKKPRAKTYVFLSEKEFETIKGNRMSEELKAKRELIKSKLRKAEDICKIPNITPDQYLRLMDGAGNFESITGMFDFCIAECLKEDPETGEARDGNAKAIKNAKSFFVRYKGHQYISYAEITPDWLAACKKWALSEIRDEKGILIKKKISPASFNMYCRELRAVMNTAQKTFNKITKESIPFGSKKEGKFSLPSTNKKKRKIKLELPIEKLVEQKNKILNHVSSRATVNKVLNYWKAAYFANGANMADVLRWKVGNIHQIENNKVIAFERKKTQNTEEENEPITVFVGPELQHVINIEGNKSLDPEEYIFPVLKRGMSSAERKKAVQDFIDMMNKRLKTASKEMKLEIALSSNSGRYLASTILDRSGIPKSVIKDLLGHGSEAMQSHYVSPYIIELRKTVAGILAG